MICKVSGSGKRSLKIVFGLDDRDFLVILVLWLDGFSNLDIRLLVMGRNQPPRG